MGLYRGKSSLNVLIVFRLQNGLIGLLKFCRAFRYNKGLQACSKHSKWNFNMVVSGSHL